MNFVHDDSSVEVVEINEELIATVKAWVQIKIGNQFYTVEKEFAGQLILQNGPAPF